MAELHPGAARKIRGRLEGARLLTIGLEGWFLPFEEGQARHNIPRTVPLSTASPKKAAETRHTIPSKEGNAPLSTVTIYSIKEGIREIPVNMKREPLPLPAPKIGTHVRNTPNARRRTGEHDEKATAREGRGQPLKPILLCSGCTTNAARNSAQFSAQFGTPCFGLFLMLAQHMQSPGDFSPGLFV